MVRHSHHYCHWALCLTWPHTSAVILHTLATTVQLTVQHSTATLLSLYSGGRHSTTGGQETIHNPGGPMMGTLQVGGHIRCQYWTQSTHYFLDVIHYLYGWWMMWILRTDTRLTTMNHEDRRREDVRKWKLGVTTWHQNGPGPGSTFSCTRHSPCHLNWTDTMSYSILFSYSVHDIITTLGLAAEQTLH